MRTFIKQFSFTAIFLLTSALTFSTPLHGTYTVGSGGDYPTINSAISNAANEGIDNAVTFDIITGTYSEEVVIGIIPGSSSINTVTLRSQTGNPADVLINGIVNVFNINSSNITIEKITLGSSTSNSVSLGGTNISFTDNNFNGGSLKIPPYSISSYIYIRDNQNITDIHFEGADFGMFNSHVEITNNNIIGNVFLLYCYHVLFENNTVGGGFWTLYFSGSVVKNRINGYLQSGGFISNNFIFGTVRAYGSTLKNNTIYGGTTYSPTIVCVESVYLLNNIVINPDGGTALSTLDYAGIIRSSDYNNFYNGGNSFLLSLRGISYDNVVDFYAASGLDQHSNSVPVNFLSASDLHLAGASIGDVQLAGIPDPLVIDDIDNQLRSPVHPYKGADEASDFPLPVELSSFISSVTNTNVILNWTTASETNNSRFEIERSDVKGQTSDVWSKIGFVNGHGTSTSSNTYEFTDRNLNSGKYKYRLKQIDYNGNFEYFNLSEEVVIGIPDKFEISQNYPNPFNPSTNLEFGISNLEFVSLKVYDILGNEVMTLVNEMKQPGRYKVVFDGSNLSSGVYYYKIQAGDFSAVKRMTLVK